MTSKTKKTLKEVGFIVGGFGVYTLLAHVIPTGSFTQKIMMGIMITALVGAMIWFTPIGNPLKQYLRKRKEKK